MTIEIIRLEANKEQGHSDRVSITSNCEGRRAPAIASEAAPFKSNVGVTRSSWTATVDDGSMSARSEQTELRNLAIEVAKETRRIDRDANNRDGKCAQAKRPKTT